MNTEEREEEIFTEIVGYEKKYEISSWGNVVSLTYRRRGFRKTLSLTSDKDEYLTVALCKNGQVKRLRVSRLVGIHFIPNPENLPEINHKYGDKKNNYYKDLEWSTRRDNSIHALLTGLRPYGTEKQKRSC